VSDIALKQPLPEELAQDIMAYVGCIAGAVLIADYERGLREAGFSAVQVLDTGKDLNAYAKVENQAGCCAQQMPAGSLPVAKDCCAGEGSATQAIHDHLADLLRKHNVNDYAASVQVFALKAS
jgi:hypothetical protein